VNESSINQHISKEKLGYQKQVAKNKNNILIEFVFFHISVIMCRVCCGG
jgi:hypothetical protein